MLISLKFTSRFEEVILSTSIRNISHTVTLPKQIAHNCGLLSRNPKKSSKQSPHHQNFLLVFQPEIIFVV